MDAAVRLEWVHANPNASRAAVRSAATGRPSQVEGSSGTERALAERDVVAGAGAWLGGGREAGPAVSQCRGCGEPIVFVKVERKAGGTSTMPVDPEPTDRGNVAAHRDGTGTWRGHVLGKEEEAASFETVFMPHFASCDAMKKREPTVLPDNVVRLDDARRRRRK
jgi:hypothetical protein